MEHPIALGDIEERSSGIGDSMDDSPFPPKSSVDHKRQQLILLSPIAVIGLGHLVARVAGPKLGPWAWGFLFLGYWATLGALIAWGGGKKSVTRWLQPSKGSRLWPLLAVAFKDAVGHQGAGGKGNVVVFDARSEK